MEQAVIVVAHPDDEILWGAGLPMRFKQFEWTVICCSIPVIDPIRAWHFYDVCKVLGVEGRVMPVSEDELRLKWLDLTGFDHIVTHGRKYNGGGYDHLQHLEIHDFIKMHYSHKPITTFGYQDKGEHRLLLDEEEGERKMQAFKQYRADRLYQGKTMVTWAALREIHKRNFNLNVETYDGAWFT